MTRLPEATILRRRIERLREALRAIQVPAIATGWKDAAEMRVLARIALDHDSLEPCATCGDVRCEDVPCRWHPDTTLEAWREDELAEADAKGDA
jgi:hypothetical protein